MSPALREVVHGASLALVAITVIPMVCVGIEHTPLPLAFAAFLAALVAGWTRVEDGQHVPSDAPGAATYSLPTNHKRTAGVCAARAHGKQPAQSGGHRP